MQQKLIPGFPLNSSIKLALPKILFFFLTTLTLYSCNSGEEKIDKVKVYYDVKGFAETQIRLLQAKTPIVNKALMTNGQSETRSSKEIDWKKELELFVQADINKPAYRQSYEIKRPDSLTYEYHLKPGETLTVQQLSVKLDHISGKPSKIHALLISKNKLYESQKNIELTCKFDGEEWLVSTYHVKGFQQLSILSARTFDITGKVQF